MWGTWREGFFTGDPERYIERDISRETQKCPECGYPSP